MASLHCPFKESSQRDSGAIVVLTIHTSHIRTVRIEPLLVQDRFIPDSCHQFSVKFPVKILS